MRNKEIFDMHTLDNDLETSCILICVVVGQPPLKLKFLITMNTSIVAGNFVPERIYFSSFFSSFFRLSNTINNETERGGLD